MTAIIRTLLIGDAEHEIEVGATITPFDPGVLSGPPEDCYPPEGGEVEDLEARILLAGKVEILDGKVVLVLDESDLRALAGAEWVDYAVEELREADDRAYIEAQEERAAREEDYSDARFDR